MYCTTQTEARAGFTIPGAVAWSGLSRSALYRYAAEGRLIFRKAGRTTIVDGASLADLIANLPTAQIGSMTTPRLGASGVEAQRSAA
jgi:hypothetical protein